MQIGTTCYWVHLNCSTGPPYRAFHNKWEPCSCNSCLCAGVDCTDPEAFAAAAGDPADKDNPYVPIDPLSDFTDKGVQDKFDDSKWHERRTIHYANGTKGLKVKIAGTNDAVEIQLVKIKAKLKKEAKNQTFWVGYEVSMAAAEHDEITGTKVGNTVILAEDDLNNLKIDVDDDLVVILKDFVAEISP